MKKEIEGMRKEWHNKKKAEIFDPFQLKEARPMTIPNVYDQLIVRQIHELVRACGGNPDLFEGDLITQLIQTSLKLISEGHDTGQLKLITRALKEMRYAYRIFNEYKDTSIISIFGSARTPEDHGDYQAAKIFSKQMAEKGWMIITGAAEGIMKAGLEGPAINSGFGLSIQLPKESSANSVIQGDPKHITFRYFFTRKLMFVSHSRAVAAFPGGFGTQDELFEVLTLIQTGKAIVIPIVLLEGENGNYWKNWEFFIQRQMLDKSWISPEDQHLYFIAPSIDEALKHIEQFYKNYHSSRYVREKLVLRMKKNLLAEHLEEINQTFTDLLESGSFIQTKALEEELDYLELPRLVFHHNRRNFGLLRRLIDKINMY